MRPAGRVPPTVGEWPDPVPTAAGGALLLALLSPLWPGLLSAVAALAALAAAALIVRFAELPVGRRRSQLGALRWPLAGSVGAWVLFGVGSSLPPELRALPLAIVTLWVARSARTVSEASGP
ncbi:MAG: hypothetical protein ACYDFT_07240 [Thermoplasmata archaeon]